MISINNRSLYCSLAIAVLSLLFTVSVEGDGRARAGVTPLEIRSDNLELVLSSYRYVAVLFYDKSVASGAVFDAYIEACELIDELAPGAIMAHVSVDTPGSSIAEFVEAYGISIPSMQVFRRSELMYYRGPTLTTVVPVEEEEEETGDHAEDIDVGSGSDSGSGSDNDNSLSERIAAYFESDSQPSISLLESIDEMLYALHQNPLTVVIAIFPASDIALELGSESRAIRSRGGDSVSGGHKVAEDDGGFLLDQGYSLDAWGQYLATADILKGFAEFYCMSSDSAEIMYGFGLWQEQEQQQQSEGIKSDDGDTHRVEHSVESQLQLPVVFVVPSGEEGQEMLRYGGEMLSRNLQEFVMQYTDIKEMIELNLDNPLGEMSATHFFLSQKMKFVLFLPAESATESHKQQQQIIEQLRSVADTLKDLAVFSYIKVPFSGINNVPISVAMQDICVFFDVDIQALREPILVAHQSATNFQFKSYPLRIVDGKIAKNRLEQFVVGVLSGGIDRVLKSEPLPSPPPHPANSNSRHSNNNIPLRKDREAAVSAVGSNVVSIASQHDKDVLLLLYKPWCSTCADLLPTYEVLARALEGESRVVIAKIDMQKNDVPDMWLLLDHHHQQQRQQRREEEEEESDWPSGANSVEFPLLLWFPVIDKHQSCGDGRDGNAEQCQTKQSGEQEQEQQEQVLPVPRSYWSAGTDLHTLSTFILREFSFDKSTYRGATIDQLDMLRETEKELRDAYKEKYRQYQCNMNRVMYTTDALGGWLPWKVNLDYWFGEIVFDGKRGHIGLAVLCATAVVLHYLYLLLRINGGKEGIKKKEVGAQPCTPLVKVETTLVTSTDPTSDE